MAWTFTTLKNALQDYLETTETTFVDNLPTIITQAEDRILKSVQLPDFRKNSTGVTTSSNKYLKCPSDFLAPYSLSVDNSGYEFLLFKDVNFIREAYPSSLLVIATSDWCRWQRLVMPSINAFGFCSISRLCEHLLPPDSC